jgi:hypothetical protein
MNKLFILWFHMSVLVNHRLNAENASLFWGRLFWGRLTILTILPTVFWGRLTILTILPKSLVENPTTEIKKSQMSLLQVKTYTKT